MRRPPPESSEALEHLYERVSDWMAIADFHAAVQAYFEGARSRHEIEAYREKSGRLKKLRDEIVPVSNYLRYRRIRAGDIRFGLDNQMPDCWLRSTRSAASAQGIEVTVALARSAYWIGREANERRIARGFYGLQDDAAKDAFLRKHASQRIMHSTAHALETVALGVERCLARKSSPRFAGIDLVIEAPLHILPSERWRRVKARLQTAATRTHFGRVTVVGDRATKTGTSVLGLRLK